MTRMYRTRGWSLHFHSVIGSTIKNQDLSRESVPEFSYVAARKQSAGQKELWP
jgi:hypothetical protein